MTNKNDDSRQIALLGFCLAAILILSFLEIAPVLAVLGIGFWAGWSYGHARGQHVEAEKHRVSPNVEVQFTGDIAGVKDAVQKSLGQP